MHQNSDNPRQFNDADLIRLRDFAVQRCGDIAIELLGAPSEACNTELRWGTKGSLALDLGRRRGLWYDHENGEGGDVIALIERVEGVDFHDAVVWLNNHLGLPQRDTQAVHKRNVTSDAERTEIAQMIWRQGYSLRGSPGMAYFAGRGLFVDPVARKMRWDARMGAIVAPFRQIGAPDTIVAVHRIIPSPKKKRTFGPPLGAAVMLLPIVNSTLTICEGIESGLGALARGVVEGGLWAMTSSSLLGALDPIPGVKRLIIAGDSDYPGHIAGDNLVERWEDEAPEIEIEKRFPRLWGRDWADGDAS